LDRSSDSRCRSARKRTLHLREVPHGDRAEDARCAVLGSLPRTGRCRSALGQRSKRRAWSAEAAVRGLRVRSDGECGSARFRIPRRHGYRCAGRCSNQRGGCDRGQRSPPCSPNDLRRTYATWLRAQGVEPQLIGAAMGHRDSRMVERVTGAYPSTRWRSSVRETPGVHRHPDCLSKVDPRDPLTKMTKIVS